MQDLTGSPVSFNDVQEAIKAVQTAMVQSITKMPPELAVQLPNINRCLMQLLMQMDKAERER